MGSKLTNAEKEVLIRWDLEERIAHIESHDERTNAKLDALCAELPDVYKREYEDRYGKGYSCDCKLIRFGKPMSEERREAARQRAVKSGFGHR